MATKEQWERMEEGIVAALCHQDNYELAVTVAEALDAGRWRVVCRFHRDDDNKPDPFTLCYRVEVWLDGEWQGLYDVHWQQLGMTLDDVFEELANSVAQQEMGIYPGGPADISPGPDD